MEVRKRSPESKYQRQFGTGEGVMTVDRRADLLGDTTPTLLTDAQVRMFLANGLLQLQPTLPRDYHSCMYARFVDIIGDDNDDNPGNNLLPVVPELQLLYDDPVIKGALTSVLGEGYLMHPHRVLHDNPPGSDQQVWHHALTLGVALTDADHGVRFNASLALARMGPAAAPALDDLLQALRDGNRYVMGYAVEALERIGTAEARDALIRFLKISRWCPLTSNKDLF